MDDKVPPAAGAATVIVGRLRESIARGAYLPGHRLPPERQLARQFGTSRSTIRAALRQLEEMALVSRRIGSGTFVGSVLEPVRSRYGPMNVEIAASTSPLQLIDVRDAVEPHVARMAVLHARASDIEALAAAVAALEGSGAEPEGFSNADEHFHQTLAEATGNPLMGWLYCQINEVRRHDQWGEMKRALLTPHRIDVYNAQHRAIYRAIRRRDVDGAVRAGEAHLDQVRSDLMGAGLRR